MNNLIEFPLKEKKDLRKEFSEKLNILSQKKYDLFEYIESVENYGHMMFSNKNFPLNENELLGCDLKNIIYYYFGEKKNIDEQLQTNVPISS